ncbi:MAG: hypothetical protein IJ619_06135 [Eubacterium sp.]|nr:hypothetical protein [Eubacterium sp.]
MSQKDQVSKRKETYRSAAKKVKHDQELYDAFRRLNSAIPQRKRRTPLSVLDLSNMETAYRNTINKLNEKMEQLSTRIDEQPAGNKRQIAAKKKMEAQYEYYTKLRKTLSKDLKAVTVCKKLPEQQLPNVTQFYENARSERMEYDIRKAPKFGGGINTRYRITTPDKDGFFTVSKKGMSDSEKKEMEIDEINRKYGNKSIFNTYNRNNIRNLAQILLRNDRIKNMILDKYDLFLTKASRSISRREIKDEFIDCINKGNVTDEAKPVFANIIQEIKPGEMLSLFEYMQAAHRIDNGSSLNRDIGINAKSKQDKRNCAMTMLSDMLGRKDLLASSTNLQIRDPETGKIINGTFMETAEGVDCQSAKKEDLEKFNQLTPEKIEGSLQLKKDIADLQILDWLGGNSDRNPRNMMYKFDEAGNLCGLVGIDNDLTFGKEDHAKNCEGIYLENMNVITKEMADKVMNMNREEFKNMLFGYDLSTAEVNRALKRLDDLQTKLENDKEYFMGMPPEYIEDGRIRIVDDEQLGNISFYKSLAGGKMKLNPEMEIQGRMKKNLFTSISEYGIDAKGYDNSITTATESILKDNVNVLREATLLDKRIDAMDASEAKTYRTHQPFRDMITAMKGVKNTYDFVSNGLVKPKHDGSVEVSEENIQAYKKALEDAVKKCDDYMATKDEAKIMKMSKTSNGYERYMLARESKEGIQKTLEALNGMFEKSELIDDYRYKVERHKAVCQNQMKKIEERDNPKREELLKKAKEVNQKRGVNMNKPEVAVYL